VTLDDDDRPRDRPHTAAWLALTALLGLPLITPLLRWSAVACTHDGHLHYHRVAALAHAWGEGIYLTRWLPDLAYGYGYPFFVYREAAPLYAVLLPHLAGLPLPAASNLFYALTILLCGTFMFLWVRDLFGPRPALVSAVAYMAAPYVLVDALVRGNAPESLALPLFPFLLWVGRRWVLFGSVRAFLAGVLGLALLSISHNISTFIFAPSLAVYLLAISLVADRRPPTTDRQSYEPSDSLIENDQNDQKETNGAGYSSSGQRSAVGGRLFRMVALIILGLGLAFFYTGGALLEMDAVTLEMSTTTRNNDWRFNFATPGEILSPARPEDPTLVNPPLLFRLGWVPLLLAAAGATGVVWIKGGDRRAREQRLHIWLMLAAAAVYLFMALPLSRQLWDALPLIDFLQFPWRFVGRAALPVAFLAGAPFVWYERRLPADDRPQTTDRSRNKIVVRGLWSVAFLAAVALLIIEAIPNLYPRLCREEPFPTIQTVHAYEHATGLVGVDPEGSYFPRTVQQRPTGSPLEADYAAGRAPQRFDATALPAGATLSDVAYDRFGVSLIVETPQPFTARYLSFAFPGWSVRVDGEPVPIAPEEPSGLITFEVPAGTHTIKVAWGATPLRLALVGLSALAGIGAVGVAVWAGRRRPPTDDRRRTTADRQIERRGHWSILLLTALALLGIKLVIDRIDTPLRQAGRPPVANTTAIQGGALRLNGFNLSREQVAAGETFDVDMAWTAIAAPAVDYQSEISLVGPDGLAWSEKGTQRPRLYEDAPPTRQWEPGEWGWDSREVQTLSGTPPGTYDVVVTLFDRATLAPVTLSDATTGAAIGPTAVIGQVEVVNPNEPPAFDLQYPADSLLPDSGLRLLGYNQDRTDVAPGEAILLTLFWECGDPSLCDRFMLRLSDERGTTAREWSLPAIQDGFPTSAWPDHGRLRGQHAVQLPADLAGGRYRFYLEDYPLGEITITAPERQFTAPPLARAVGATFTTADGRPVATLAGPAADPPCFPASQLPCDLPLVWRAESSPPISYHVFVHLVDGAGNILAQSDAVPANWTRPTTGWRPGEYVTDVHTLVLPAELPGGPLTVRVGLYDPATGARLMAGDQDFVAIELPVAP